MYYPLQLWGLGCWLLHILVCCHNMQWCMAIRTCCVHISSIPHQDLHNSRMFLLNSQAQRSQVLQMVFCIQIATGLRWNDNKLVTLLSSCYTLGTILYSSVYGIQYLMYHRSK